MEGQTDGRFPSTPLDVIPPLFRVGDKWHPLPSVLQGFTEPLVQFLTRWLKHPELGDTVLEGFLLL